MKTISILLIILLSIGLAHASHPDCANSKGWARSLGYYYFKKAKLLRPGDFDHKRLHVIRLASEQVDDDLFRQVHYFSYEKLNGENISLVLTNAASSSECPLGSVNAYVVSQVLDYNN